MFRSCSQPNSWRRATAWLLLLVCAWMGIGGVLHHTEAEGAAPAAWAKAASSLHHATVVPDDACAACEWTQGLQGHAPSISLLSFPLFLLPLRPCPALPAPIARTPCHRPSRAPPVFSA